MDARPNVLNKILPCYKIIPMLFRTTTGGVGNINELLGYVFDPDVDENSYYSTVIPNDMKAGSDVVLVLDGCPMAGNVSGSDKKVRISTAYNYGRLGQVVGTAQAGTPVLITIPDEQVAYTMHKIEVVTISDLAANDYLSIKVNRDADHVDDTYTGDWFFAHSWALRYIRDNIGVLV